ncbi:MAG: hypothetical protein ACKO96_45865 [Flammeovirgaceae bacterium]
MICLHGMNSDRVVMEYQIRHLKACFNQVIDFVCIDGPFECLAEPPKELLKFLGSNTAFREWYRLNVPERFAYPLEDSVNYLKSKLAEAHYDGVIAFS